MPGRFYTIGHSTRTIPEFVDLLRDVGAQIVVDVRTVPRSRTNPHFNRDVLPESLKAFQIGYDHIAELGGLRGKQRRDELSPNTYWENDSFRNYADYALSDSYRTGLARLIELGSRSIPAVMCAEAVWWRCHRQLTADALLTRGLDVCHITSTSPAAAHKLTEFARVVDGQVHYPGLLGG